MRGVYRLAGTRATVTSGITLCTLGTSATTMIEILSARVSCDDEETSEQMVVELNRCATAGTGGTEPTAKPTEEQSAATDTAERIGITSPPTFDADADAIARGSVNKLAGWEYVPLPEERAIIGISQFVGLQTDSTIVSCTLSFEIIYREIG